MDLEDPFISGGATLLEGEEDLEYETEEFGASVADFERTALGVRKTPQELWRLRRDPKEYSKYQLSFEIYENPPFANMPELIPEVIFSELKDFPSLETTNIGVLVMAYLYRQKFPKGRVTSQDLEKFQRPFQDFVNKVDLFRYIQMYDRYRMQN